jgi:hypothetical protein
VRQRRTFGFAVVIAGLTPLLFFATIQQAGASTSARGSSPATKNLLTMKGHALKPVPGDVADAINTMGTAKYASLYAGDVVRPGGGVTVLLGPGSATKFRAAVTGLKAESAVKAFGREPAVTIERVPESIGVLDASSRTVTSHNAQLRTAGYKLAHWWPDPQKGTVDVALSSVPKGVSLSAATSYLRRTLSPHVVVTSISAPVPQVASNRGQDTVPFFGSDLIYAPALDAWCTSGFTVIGTAGYPRAMTAAHCGDASFTNGGWDAPIGGGIPTSDGGSSSKFGTTSNYHFQGGTTTDVQLLENPIEDGFGPYVWGGAGTAQPTPLAVAAPLAGFPAIGEQLTTDGSFTRMVRYVPVLDSGSGDCVNLNDNGSTVTVCNLIILQGKNANGVTPVVQGGDSGGPVFCYSCASSGISPAGEIEGDSTSGSTEQYAYVIDIAADLGITGSKIDG